MLFDQFILASANYKRYWNRSVISNSGVWTTLYVIAEIWILMEAFDGVSRPILDLVVVSMLSRSVMRSKHVVDEYIIVSDSVHACCQAMHSWRCQSGKAMSLMRSPRLPYSWLWFLIEFVSFGTVSQAFHIKDLSCLDEFMRSLSWDSEIVPLPHTFGVSALTDSWGKCSYVL